MKLCKDCRHATARKCRFFWWAWDDWREGSCAAVGSISVIDGTSMPETIKHARLAHHSPCGKEGKLWEPRS